MIKTITNPQLRRAKNSAQLEMWMTDSDVFVGDIRVLPMESIYASYNSFMAGKTKWSKHMFVNKFINTKIEEFMGVMGDLYIRGISRHEAGECLRMFQAFLYQMNKEIRVAIDAMIVSGIDHYSKIFAEATNTADRVMAKKRNGGTYVKTVEASKWKGYTIKERHDIEREAKKDSIYAFLRAKGLVDDTNTRTASLRDIYEIIRTSEEILDGINMPVWAVTRADLEYVFKAMNVAGRKAGRPKKEVKNEGDSVCNSSSNSDDSVIPDVCDNGNSNDCSIVPDNIVAICDSRMDNMENTDDSVDPEEKLCSDLIFKWMDENRDFWWHCNFSAQRGNTEHSNLTRKLLEAEGKFTMSRFDTIMDMINDSLEESDIPKETETSWYAKEVA